MSKQLSLLHITTAAREWGYSDRHFRILLDDYAVPLIEWETTNGNPKLFVKRVDLAPVPRKAIAKGKDWMRRKA